MPQLSKSMLFLFLAQSCVGVNIVVSKILLSHTGPIQLLTVRFSVASLFMAVMALSAKVPLKLSMPAKDWGVLLAEGIGAGIAFNLIMLSGLYFTDANSAGLITSLLPAVVIGLNILLFKQRLTRKMTVSVTVSVLGLALINYTAIGSGNRSLLVGNFLIFLSLIPDSLYYVLSKLHPLKINPLAKVFWLNALNLPFLYLIAVFMPAGSFSGLVLHDWVLMGIVGLGSAGFFLFWQKGIQDIDAAYAALSTAFMPVATVIIAFIVLGEGMGGSKILGMLLVIASIVNYARVH